MGDGATDTRPAKHLLLAEGRKGKARFSQGEGCRARVDSGQILLGIYFMVIAWKRVVAWLLAAEQVLARVCRVNEWHTLTSRYVRELLKQKHQ